MNQELTKLQFDEKLKEEFTLSKGAIAAWTNPKTKWVSTHASGNPESFPFNDRQREVINVDSYNKYIALKDAGKLTEGEYQDKINFAIWNQKDGWDEKAKIWLDNIKNVGIGADADVQGIKPADYAGLENTVVETIIYGMQERLRTAQMALRVVNVSGTKRTYPEVTSRVNVLRNIDFSQDIPIQSMGLKTTDLNLKCDAAAFAIYDHVGYRPHSLDILRTNIEGYGLAFVRDQADQVVALIFSTGVTAVSGASWETSTNNPYLDLEKAQGAIAANNGRANKLMMNSIARAVMRGNPNTKTSNMTSNIEASGGQVVNGDIFIPGYTNYIDPGPGNQVACMWDDDFVEWNQGPAGTVTDRENRRFRNTYVRFTWNLPKIIDGGKIRRITGINAQ